MDRHHASSSRDTSTSPCDHNGKLFFHIFLNNKYILF